MVTPPVIILIEPTTDGVVEHQHIDCIYFCRPVGEQRTLTEADPTLRWVSRAEIEANEPVSPLPGHPAEAIPEDVRALALAALDQEGALRDGYPRRP